MRLALLDHRDSFTLNVRDWLAFGGSSGAPEVAVEVVPAEDGDAVAKVLADRLPLVLSPGPKRPQDAPETLAALRAALGRVPVLGVCLGHQLLAYFAGALVVPARSPFHGTTRRIIPVEPRSRLFAASAPSFRAAVYNSLAIEAATLPAPWRVTAYCELGDVAALERDVPGEAPAFGVQFHPESFLSEGASALRESWLAVVRDDQARGRATAHASATAPLSMPS
jgi:anthranilate synthase/aminodeoxychorismate synthase-like glutamine amidotransferase